MNDATPKTPVVIIGTGLSGYNVAKEFRKLDAETPLLLISSDDGSSYSKPMLSTGFTKKKSATELVLSDPGKMAAQLDATVRTNTLVTGIEPDAKRILIGSESIEYSKLVLAWGAASIRPRIEGDADSHIFSINSLEDYKAFRAFADDKKRVVILGAGLIGCEFANDLANGGYEVEVVAPSDRVLANLVPAAASEAVQRGLEGLGVKFHLGPLATRVSKTEDGVSVLLSNSQTIEADFVVSAIGLRPRIDLAAKAGLQVHHGVVVDQTLQTSAKDIYALGDCAEVEGHTLLYVLPLMASARALAKTLTGAPTPVNYGVMPVTVKTPCCPTVVNPPPKGCAGDWQIEQDADNVKGLFVSSEGETKGFVLTGSYVKEKAALSKQMPAILPLPEMA